MARHNERGEIVSNDGRWRWTGGTVFDLKLEQWAPVAPARDAIRMATRFRLFVDPRRRPGRGETREAARLALEASDEWKRLEELRLKAQADIDRLTPQAG